MDPRRTKATRPSGRRLLAGTALAVGLIAATTAEANAATVATFGAGTLSVIGDNADNSVAISRDAAGRILVNGGAIAVVGGTPTVANVAQIQVFGQGGQDALRLDEANGALPRANLFGGTGNDVLTGGSGGDQLFGQSGNDTLLGKGGTDGLFGGADNDVVTGGDADDQAFGEAGNDRMVWSRGDDTDLNEGGAGTDTVEVNGGNGSEQFTATANGSRVRFDQVAPSQFAIDIGTSENLVVNANGGGDRFSASGDLASLIRVTVDGGAGSDTLLGSNGPDVMLGGDGADFADGNQGDDVALLGAGNDTFQWDPGDGSDVIEGQAGTDAMAFNGSGANENMDVSANGGRVRFFRDVAAITMDLDDVETINARTLGGSDRVTVGDLSGTDAVDVAADQAATGGGDDTQPDTVVVTGTNGDDVVSVTGAGASQEVSGLAARVTVSGAFSAGDRLTVNAVGGDDVVDASALAATAARLTVDGGAGDDVLLGGAGADTLLGGAGDDVLLGGPAADTLDGGAGSNVVIDGADANRVTSARVAGREWLDAHARVVAGRTVLDVGGKQRTLPRADLAGLVRGASPA
jgi:Ca2+-binding RTX toxin-like protein